MLVEFTNKLIDGRDLTQVEMRLAMETILSDGDHTASTAAFLTALRMKGETVEELVATAHVLRSYSQRVVHHQPILLDTCGTGGDSARTFNISTTAAIVIAAGGVPVGKHGNRAVSSRSGSADLLEALGVNIALTSKQVGECIDQIGLGFMFAPAHHPALQHVAPIRRELAFRTIFNLLGPLCNPANATHQVIGVFESRYLPTMVQAASALSLKHVCAVHNSAGIDELAPIGENVITTMSNEKPEALNIRSAELGLRECTLIELRGGDANTNARITREVLSGSGGARRDAVALNAALGFYITKRVASLQEGVDLAFTVISDGLAKAKLEQLIEFSRSCSNA